MGIKDSLIKIGKAALQRHKVDPIEIFLYKYGNKNDFEALKLLYLNHLRDKNYILSKQEEEYRKRIEALCVETNNYFEKLLLYYSNKGVCTKEELYNDMTFMSYINTLIKMQEKACELMYEAMNIE